MHQLVEYVLGGVLVAQGLQSPQPVVPAVAGFLVLANASTVRDGALSAFRVVSRRTHRIVDVMVIIAIVLMAIQPWIEVDGGARIVVLAIAAVMGFVWWQSSFAEKQRRTTVAGDGGVGTEIGRRAGRMVGDGINAAKRWKKS